jgi:chromosome segregation protein
LWQLRDLRTFAVKIPAAMRLKTLTLTGYKTFASKMKFEFGDGITCIIGPNGSGKSNIADGIRWALGEQQFSLLRGKRTDDMIFSGSVKRPRASMAEVLMTFDNSDGFFPIEFSEIEIGRRAFRDGANEYVLNGNRVRLRDVSDLLGHSGLAERTYTVIGQGLVDNALAQKPEERRALFEEAAGIGAYRDRREDALRKLDETRHNLERARDILTEITPRLRQLERQAERARQYTGLAEALDGHTRTYLGFHYRHLLRKIEASTVTRDAAQHAVTEAVTAVNARDAEGDDLRTQRTNLQHKLAEAQPKRDDARRAADAAARELAVLRERTVALERQLADAQRDLNEHAATIEVLTARATEASTAFVLAQNAHQQKLQEFEAAQQGAAARQDERMVLEQRRDDARAELQAANAALLDAQNTIAGLRARQDALRGQLDTLSRRATDLGTQRETELATFTQLNAGIQLDTTQGNLFDSQYEEAQHALEVARATLIQAQSAYAAAEAEEKLTSRMSLFAEMRAQQSADELAEAANASNLSGVRGVLSTFLHIHTDDQKAVEAALGDVLNAVIMVPQHDSEHDLAAVRAWLTDQPSGRMAIALTPALRAYDNDRAHNDQILNDHARTNGARPLVDVIGAPDWLRAAVNVIAGRKYIARDLDAARYLAAQLPDGSLCVTRDGEVAHAIGTLSLPAGARAPIVLGADDVAEVEAFALDPDTAQANLAQALRTRESAQHEFELTREMLAVAMRSRDSFAKETIARKNRLDDAERKVNRVEETLAALLGDMDAIEQEIGTLDTQIEDANNSLAQLHEAQTQAQTLVQEAETALNQQLSGGWFEALNAAQTQVAAALTVVQNAELLQRDRDSAHQSAITQREARAARVSEFDAQLAMVRHAAEQQSEAVAQADAAYREAVDAIAPIQQQISDVESHLNELDARKRDAERTLRERESQLNAHVLELARHNDELENLRQRAAELMAREEVERGEGSVDGVAPATGGLAGESRSTSPSMLDTLPVVDELPDGTEERIAQLRGQIKRLGAINYEAQAEFEELNKRHTFITEQCDDLEKASASLQQVIAELNDVIIVTFRQTFDAIAAAFQQTFKVLFGGGQAKLSLTNADNIDECGVEIQAQPPGKRPQSLALLSGGERSLTATSLLFAILQVKPTPFCVLDEVDAALDESNVGRFRSMVESLSDNTQFIIITHNRRTVEAATTIYGISMGTDGASTALSLKLDEVK